MSGLVEVERGNASNEYQLLARLAEGGMAEIFLARANGLAGFERYVVLKRIRPERGEDPRWVTMFLDEARLAAQLQHPNIAQVFDLGQIADAYFYTMEYVHGEDVRDILVRTEALHQYLPLEIILSIVVGAASGLEYAHNRRSADGRTLNIVHRDVSPSNLMVSYEGLVKLVDFGVAKARSRSSETEAGTILGKVAYLSPEQCQTSAIDHRSDVFSLGIVMYEMLTYLRPFKRESDYESLQAIIRFDPPRPSSLVPTLPPALDDIVLRALAKDRDERYQSAAALIEAIEAYADVSGISLSPRDVKRFMQKLYGQPPEPWRELEVGEVPVTYSGEVVGPLPDGTHTSIAYPANTIADMVPLLKAAKRSRDAAAARRNPTPSAPQGVVVSAHSTQAPTRSLWGGEEASDEFKPTPLTAKPVRTSPPPQAVAGPPTEAIITDVVVLPPPPRANASVEVARPRSHRTFVIIISALVALGIGIGFLLAREKLMPKPVVHERPVVMPIATPNGPSPAVTGSPTVTPSATPTITAPAPAPAASAAPARTKSSTARPTGSSTSKPPASTSKPPRPAARPPDDDKPAGQPDRRKPRKCADPLDCQF